MKLIALLIGLAIERLATRLFHLRELRWLDRFIDSGFDLARRYANAPALLPIALLAFLLVLPVFVVTIALGDALLGLPYVTLAVVVLFFSLGPNDIGEDVDEYCDAVKAGDEARIRATAKALIESDVPEDPLSRTRRVEEAVCVQANNRLFGVIFWFLFLGPLGAWAFRVIDLIRRRAVFKAARHEQLEDNTGEMRDATVLLHGWAVWIPVRLTAIGYAIAGHFDAAIGSWRAPSEQRTDTASEYSEHLLGRVGTAALALHERDDEDLTERAIRGAMAANRLVFRLLLIWAVIIAALTLYGWAV